MDPQLKLWGTILGYMLLALTISACTSLWIRHHLKRNTDIIELFEQVEEGTPVTIVAG